MSSAQHLAHSDGNIRDVEAFSKDEDDTFSAASDDGMASGDGDDDMFDMFTGDVIDTERPRWDSLRDVNDDSEDDDWADVEMMAQDDPQEVPADEEGTPGAWITLPPEGKPPPNIDELRAINAGAKELFDYTELPCVDENTVRIVDILPDDAGNQGLSLMMHTARLTGPSKYYYMAVTHAGRTSGEHVQVPCNGKLLSVPKDVCGALLHISRHLDTGVWSLFGERPCIWIDVLSLEHDDRLWRARLTTDLFRRAERVLIWLGQSPFPSMSEGIKTVDDLVLAATHPAGATERQGTDYVLSRDEMVRILRDPWFKSRASLQPFAAARRRTFLLPNGKILEIAAFQQMLHDHCLEDLSGPVRDMRLFEDLRPQRSLITNLHRYAALECETPHDIVYTLLGISCVCQHATSAAQCGLKNCALRDFSISYQWPIGELFSDIARKFLAIDPVAVFVSACLRQPGAQSWPSWVPDWRIAAKHALPLTQKCIDESFGSDFNTLLWNGGFCMHDMQRWKCNQKCSPMNIGPYGWPIRLDRGIPKIIGWALPRPAAGTKVTELTWTQESAVSPRMRTPSWAEQFSRRRHGSFLQPTDSYKKMLHNMTEQERRYQTVTAAWPRLMADDVVVFVPGCRVSFVVRPAGQSAYRLVDCVARPVVLTHTRFAWLDSDGNVWAYGDCTQAPVELELA